MEATNIVTLPEVPATRDRVAVVGEHITIDSLTLTDAALATFVADRPADDRADLISRALRIGLLALQDAGASLDVDVVRREFESMVRQTETLNERGAAPVS